MAELGITPGPWVYHSAQCDPFPPTKEGLLRFVGECWDKSDGEHWGAIVADSSKMVAILGNGPTTGPNSKAFEAVPEMLDALIACRDNYGKYGGLVNDPTAPGELITKINAALEKAGVTG
ncbi:hypothetical protein [Microcystis phage Mae-JY24]